MGFEAYKRIHPGCIERKSVAGGYNCAGLVWAARRAVLPDPDDWERILKEDGYRRIADRDANVGDIVVYRSKSDRKVIHVGRVCLLDKMLVGGTAADGPRVAMILSKLGLTMGEVMHRKDHITIDGQTDFISEVFTDR